ncbi:MAG: hypothetical protein WDO15_30830 [Bacteroidota bacterium]
MRLLFVKCIVLVATISMASLETHAQRKDTTLILISNLEIQLETTQALDDLYNFKFDKAEKEFQELKQKYKWHPLPYFLIGLGEWWKIMPDTKNKSYDDRFLAYMDSLDHDRRQPA